LLFSRLLVHSQSSANRLNPDSLASSQTGSIFHNDQPQFNLLRSSFSKVNPVDSYKKPELADLSVDALTKGYASGNITPVDATLACLSRIEDFNEEVNAFCFVDREGALKAAQQSEMRWKRNEPLSPIDGVPTTSKDTTSVKGWISTAGSAVFDMKEPAKEDSSFVARLKEAGSVLLGLTTSPEIGWKGITDSPRHGITKNPWNMSTTPGGSSGGAVVAAALGMGCLHIGTDAGGSIRIPASFAGVFGLKPSFGRVPNYPPSAFSSLSHAGPIARTVKDAAHMMTVLSRPDTRDWYALPYKQEDYAVSNLGGVRDLKIAFSPNPGGNIVDEDVALRVREAAEIFKKLGASVEEKNLDISGCDKTLKAFWHASVLWRLRNLDEEQLGKLDPGLLQVFHRAQKTSLLEFQNEAQNRIELGVKANAFHRDYDLLITPTLPIPAFTVGQNIPDNSGYKEWFDWAAFCYPFNLTGQPACSIPCGFSKSGLPVGLQIVGRQFDDTTVLRAAAAFETVLPAQLPVRPMNNDDTKGMK